MYQILSQEENDRVLVRFEFQPVIAVQQVAICGSFNDWNRHSHMLEETEAEGVFRIELEISATRHEYKFLLNHSVWKTDSENPDSVSDGHGGQNSLIDLARSGDQKLLQHEPDKLLFASYVEEFRGVSLRLKTGQLNCETLQLVVLGNQSEKYFPCQKIESEGVVDWWRGEVPATELTAEELIYRFEWQDESGGRCQFPEIAHFQVNIARLKSFSVPHWVRQARFYQIFPDRFYRSNDSKLFSGLRALKKRPKGRRFRVTDAYIERWGEAPSHFNFFGGDLRGIQDKLGYLQDLGVNCLYLNPIFKAWSNHRYDAADYLKIDPRLGSLKDFRSLCQAAEARGIAVILDAAFNHTGHKHWAFQDVIRYGPKSKYWDWYFVNDFPIVRKPKPNYRCWWDFPDLPQLNTANPEVIEHLLEVAVYWLKQGAKGWRLDVPNEVHAINPSFWPRFRKCVKDFDPDCYIVGEIWHDPANWIGPDLFDATMNYPLRRALLEFFATEEMSAEQFQRTINQQQLQIPEAVHSGQFNLLGSHDTARLATLMKGNQRKLAAIFCLLFCYPGAPVVYYGDELPLRGQKDPDCRRCFPWAEPSTKLRKVIQELAELRRQEEALSAGRFRWLFARDRVLAFQRKHVDQRDFLLIVVNGQRTEKSLPLEDLGCVGEFQLLLGSESLKFDSRCLQFGGFGYAVLRVLAEA